MMAAFESWAEQEGLSILQDDVGEYVSRETRVAWRAWREATAIYGD